VKILVEFDSSKDLQDFLDWRLHRESQAAKSKTPIHGSGIEQRMVNALMSENIQFVEDALALSDSFFLRLPNIGRTSVKRLRAWGSSRGGKETI
jgi:DNA-directed RNA polymerase alpha subunit